MVVSAPWSVNSWLYDGPVSVPPSGCRWQLPANGQCSSAVSQLHRQVAVLGVRRLGGQLDVVPDCEGAGRLVDGELGRVVRRIDGSRVLVLAPSWSVTVSVTCTGRRSL